MLGSNQRPLPCEGTTGFPDASQGVRFRGLNTPISGDERTARSGCIRLRPTAVAARLLHKDEYQRDEIAEHCCSCRSPSMYALNGVEGGLSEVVGLRVHEHTGIAGP